MAISFLSAGSAVSTTTTSLALVAPTVAIDDILIAQINSNNNTAISAPTAAWVEIQQGNFTGSRAACFYKRVVAGDSGASFTFTVGGTQTSFGVISAFRGVLPNGSAIGTSTFSANASADNVTYATITSFSNNGVLVALGFYGEDLTTAGTITNFNAPSIDVEQTNAGGDSSLFMSYRQYTGGASGSLTQSTTSTLDAVNAGVLFDLMPIVEGGGGGGAKYPRLERQGRWDR